MSVETVVVVTPQEGPPAEPAVVVEAAVEAKEALSGLEAHEASGTHWTKEELLNLMVECLEEHGMVEILAVVDECGRHMMAVETTTGGEVVSPVPEATKPDGTMPSESGEGTSSVTTPVSPSGTEAAVLVVEAPVPVSAATVTAESKPRGFFGTLIFGRSR